MNKNTNLSLDAFDLAILGVLQRDNTTPQRLIGEAVNLSAPSVQRRIKRMEKTGVIAANVATVDPASVGLSLTIVVEVELVSETSKQIDDIKRLFTETPEIQQCYYVAGEVDFVLIVVIESMAAYEELARRLFLENDIVRKFSTFVSMDRVKTGSEVKL